MHKTFVFCYSSINNITQGITIMARMTLKDGSKIFVAGVIEYPEAYADATKARIIANANKTFRKNNPDTIDTIESFLMAGRIDKVRGKTIYSKNFVGSLASAYDKYGKLTEKQVETIVRLSAEKEARIEAYKKALAEQKAKSAFVGVENEKITATVKVAKVLRMSAPSFSYYDRASQEMYIMQDCAGNTYVYRTKSFFEYKFPKKQLINQSRYSNGNSYGLICDTTVMAGMTITFEATVKAHVEYKGEKQTIITRPKVLAMEWAVDDIKELVDLRE